MFVMPCFVLLSVMTFVDHFSICVCYLCVEAMFIFFINPISSFFKKEINVMTSKSKGKKRRRERCLAFENKEERDGDLKPKLNQLTC